MKYRIIASILVIAVVLALGVVFTPTPNNSSEQPASSNSEPSFSGLGK